MLALQGQADKEALDGLPHRFVKLGATNEAIAVLKAENVDTIVLAGSVHRPNVLEMKPDMRTLQLFARLGPAALGDDALLRAVAEEIEKEGFQILGAHEVDPGLITTEGVLTAKKPSPENEEDLRYGIKAAKTLGALDIGQTAVVQQGVVLGLEAVEGTDALLKRCKDLRKKGRGGVLVKGCKPQQDNRLDLPTVGLRTVQLAYEAGLEGIAVEAGASLIVDREETVAAADKFGIFLKGYKAE